MFRRVVEVMARHLADGEPLAEGERRAGRALMRGFAANPAGRVFTDRLRVLGPERALMRLPDGLQYAVVGMQLEAESLGLRCWRVRFTGSGLALPEVFCGALQGILAHAGVVGRELACIGVRPRGWFGSFLSSWRIDGT